MLKPKLLCWVIVIVFSPSIIYSQQLENSEKQVSQKAILTPELAQEKALKYLGFQKMEGFTMERNMEKASIVKVTDDKTPFLHGKLNNRDIWKVTYSDITLAPQRGYPENDDYPRTFDVYMDPDDGTLLKIESLYAGNNIDFPPEASIELSERQLKSGPNIFTEFVSSDSNYVSFLDIMNSMGPRNFKELKAQLVLRRARDNEDPTAVWFVTYRGTDPIVPKSRKAKPYNLTSYIYNAKTAKAMGWGMMTPVEPGWNK